MADVPERRGRADDPRRAARADVRLLPPGARARGAGAAHPAARRRPHGAGDRPRAARPGDDDHPAARPRQAEDPRLRHPARGAAPRPRSTGRLRAVLAVLYLVFTEGYAADRGRGADPRRARRRGDPARPRRPRAAARRARAGRPARADAAPALAPRRARRPRRRAGAARRPGPRRAGTGAAIDEALPLVDRALVARRPAGPYALQAAIAALHAGAPTAEATDWRQIAALYDELLRVQPEPGRRPQPRRRGRDGRRPGGGLVAARPDRRRARRATTPSTPPAPTSCAAPAAATRRPPPTAARSSSPARSPSARSCAARLRRDGATGRTERWRAEPALGARARGRQLRHHRRRRDA